MEHMSYRRDEWGEEEILGEKRAQTRIEPGNLAAWEHFSKMLWRMCDRLRVSIIPILLNLICL